MPKDYPLYLTDAEMAARIGIPLAEWEEAARVLEKQGLPLPEPLFRNRRYWPACRAFLDRRYDLASTSASGNPALDGEEQWGEPTPRKRGIR